MHPIARQLLTLAGKTQNEESAELLLSAAAEIDRLANIVGDGDMVELEVARLQREILDLSARTAEFEPVLRLIACGPRADGTYNYCREACQQLAIKALQNER